MENKICEAFAQIQMRTACEEKILNSFQKQSSKALWPRFAAVATVCLLIATLLFTNPNAVQALENALEAVSESITNLFLPRVLPNKLYTVPVTNPNETGTDPSTDTTISGDSYYISVPSWLEERDDGLYFLANEEELEIGSLITEEIPFTYTYTTGRMTYYFVVGGTYNPEGTPFEGVGWAMWEQDNILAETNPPAAWKGGYAAGIHDPETGENRPWYQAGKEIFGVPYP